MLHFLKVITPSFFIVAMEASPTSHKVEASPTSHKVEEVEHQTPMHYHRSFPLSLQKPLLLLTCRFLKLLLLLIKLNNFTNWNVFPCDNSLKPGASNGLSLLP